MRPEEFSEILEQTLDDLRLSRGEKKAIKERIEDADFNLDEMAHMRHLVFKAANERLSSKADREILDWAEDVVKLLVPIAEQGRKSEIGSASYFSPQEDCHVRINDLFAKAERSVDICVFTITDNRISRAITKAHRRGVKIRIITDNDKAFDRGSDIEELKETGIPVRVDFTEHHMHHKFALFDRTQVLTGSYNWTRSADAYNFENIIVTDDSNLVKSFVKEFERLWQNLQR